jgi:PKD repeat protein
MTQPSSRTVRRLFSLVSALTLAACMVLAVVSMLPGGGARPAVAAGVQAGAVTHTLVADFNVCAILNPPLNRVLTDTVVSNVDDGEIRLTAYLEDYFDGDDLDYSRWISIPRDSGPPVVANGLMTLTNVGVRSVISVPIAGRDLETRVRLQQVYTNTGFGDIALGREVWLGAERPDFLPPIVCPGEADCDGAHRVFYTDESNNVSALKRDALETPYPEQLLEDVDLTQFHVYRIDWGATNTVMSIDGVGWPTTTFASTYVYSPYVWLYTNQYGKPVEVDWVRINYYPQLTGQYQSCVMGGPLTDTHWTTLSWSADLPTGTDATLETRTSDDGVTWSGWAEVATSGGAVSNPNGTYLQYRVTLNTGDVNASPEIGSVSAGFELNEAPTASAGGPYSINESALLTVNASGSTDPNVGEALTYAWDLDNDGSYDDATGITATVTFDDGPAVRTLGVRVADTSGVTDTATTTVNVNNVNPTATFNTPSTLNEGDLFDLTLTGPADPSTADMTAGFNYRFNCGDGSGWGSFGASNSRNCEAIDNPSQQVLGEIRDKDGGSTTYTVTFSVNNVAPTAVMNTPGTVDEGGSIDVSLTTPIDPGNNDTAAGFTYAFDCGDGGGFGGFGVITSTACTALDNPSQTIRGRIRDKDNAFTTYTATVTVNNLPPAATFNAPPAAVDEGDPIGLSFTGASDPGPTDNSAGFQYAFDCGDGLGFGSFSATSSANCTAIDNPSQQVRGQVRDKDGLSATYTATVTVNNLPPDAVFNAPSAALDEGTAFSLTLTSPTDPGSADVTAGFTYAFDCGSGFSTYSTNNAFNCTALDNPNQQVRGRVRDKDGAFEQYSVTFDVNNVAPTASTTGPYSGDEGSAIAFTGVVTEPGASDAPTYLWTFGDGFTSTLRTPTHTYTDNGVYTATFKVTDKDNASATVTTTVSVANVAPTALPGGPYTGTPGQPVSFTGNQNDPGSDTFTYLWDFGDTMTSTLPSPTHVYTAPGVYTVTLIVTDDDLGVSAPATTTVNVRYMIFLPAIMRNSGASGAGQQARVGTLDGWSITIEDRLTR